MDWYGVDMSLSHHPDCPTNGITLHGYQSIGSEVFDEMRAMLEDLVTRYEQTYQEIQYQTQETTLRFTCPVCNQEAGHKFSMLTEQIEVTCPYCERSRFVRINIELCQPDRTGKGV
jgi:uncharacterized Zn-finger protein